MEYVGATIDQIRWGSNDDPRIVFEKGEILEVEWSEMHSWHTKVKIVGMPGIYNSVSFKDVYPNPWSRAGSL